MKNNSSFIYLIIGQCFANAGDVFYIVALISLVYSMTESTFFVSLVPLVNTVSAFLSGLIAPLLIDKYPLKKILFFSQFLKTILLFLLAIYSMYFLSFNTIYVLFILVGCISFLDGWAAPSRNSMIPRLVLADKLVKANSLITITDQSIKLGGWALGGIILSLLNSDGLFWITFLLYILASLLMFSIQDKKQENLEKSPVSSFKESLVEGWHLILKNKLLRTLHLLIVFEAIANTVWLSAVLYVFIQERLKLSVEWWGYLNTSLFIGLLLAGLIGYKCSFINKGLIRTMLTGSFMVFVTTFLFGINVIPWLALLLIGVNGFFDQLKGISIQTILQSTVEDRLLPKVYTAQSALITLVFGLATVLVGAISDVFNILFTFIGASTLLLISFIILFMTRNSLVNNSKKIIENKIR